MKICSCATHTIIIITKSNKLEGEGAGSDFFGSGSTYVPILLNKPYLGYSLNFHHNIIYKYTFA